MDAAPPRSRSGLRSGLESAARAGSNPAPAQLRAARAPRRHARRQVRAPGPPRHRRDGGGLPRAPRAPAPGRGREGPASRPLRLARAGRALPARGRDSRARCSTTTSSTSPTSAGATATCTSVMDLLVGESLFDRLRREGTFRPEEAVRVLWQMCARPRGRARARGGPPRPQAGERVPRADRERARGGQGPRLRDREDRRSGSGSSPRRPGWWSARPSTWRRSRPRAARWTGGPISTRWGSSGGAR